MAPRLRAPRGARQGKDDNVHSQVFISLISLEKKTADPPRGRPAGGGGFIVTGGMGASAPIKENTQ